jgi:2-polyprenyl-6-methoxyphenol hydroxylase-like FAD-dependent oxidoreductase
MERTIVIGGSIAGLLAARVLADRSREVLIAERDRLPEQPELRAGVPQARHAHILLERGRRIIETLFPGICNEMVAAGARLYDVGRDVSFISWAGDAVRFDAGIPFLAVSRPFLEHHVRRRLLALPNVVARPETRVVGLAGARERVTGVRIHGSDVLSADLVVDGSGRESRLPEWLKALGVAPPLETVVKPFLGYASRIYQPSERTVWDRVALIASSLPPAFTRGVALFPIERGRYLVTLLGLNADYPPTHEDGYLEYARSLAVPGLSEWLAAATPAGEIHGFRFEQNRLRHYERCALPAGVLAIGDSVASFNPIYGQGMTMSAIGAEVLGTVLAEGPRAAALPRRFHRRLATVLKEPWTTTTTEDLRYPGTEGERTLSHRIAYAYIDRLFVLTASDVAARRALIEVFGMTKPGSHLFRLPLALRAMTTAIPRSVKRPQEALRSAGTST